MHYRFRCVCSFARYPAYYLLLKLRAIRWWSTILVGFVLGAIPMAVFTWPLKYPELKTSASVDGVQTMINGIPTVAGWLQFIYGVSFFGVCGIAGALAFWLVAPNKQLQPTAVASAE